MEKTELRQGFLAMSSLLQDIYRSNPAGDLGNLLTDLNPIRFSSRHISSFPAFEDYADLYQKEKALHKTKAKASFHASVDFLLLYEREFDFHLKDTIASFQQSDYEAELAKLKAQYEQINQKRAAAK